MAAETEEFVKDTEAPVFEIFCDPAEGGCGSRFKSQDNRVIQEKYAVHKIDCPGPRETWPENQPESQS